MLGSHLSLYRLGVPYSRFSRKSGHSFPFLWLSPARLLAASVKAWANCFSLLIHSLHLSSLFIKRIGTSCRQAPCASHFWLVFICPCDRSSKHLFKWSCLFRRTQEQASSVEMYWLALAVNLTEFSIIYEEDLSWWIVHIRLGCGHVCEKPPWLFVDVLWAAPFPDQVVLVYVRKLAKHGPSWEVASDVSSKFLL